MQVKGTTKTIIDNEFIKKLLKKADITRSELSRELNINPGTLSKAYHGLGWLPVEDWQRILIYVYEKIDSK